MIDILQHLIPTGVREEVERVLHKLEGDWDDLRAKVEALDAKLDRILAHMEEPFDGDDRDP